MLSPKLRRKLLMKWAQVPGAPSAPGGPASPASPASPSSPASPASPASPTDPASSTANKKSPSQPASSMLNVGIGWPNWVQYIDGLVKSIDKVIIAGTKQSFNFNDLFQQRFPSGVDSDYPPPDPTGDVIRFGRQIYQQLMNNGTPFTGPLQTGDMRARVYALLQSPYLQKFQQINPSGPLGSSGAQLSTLRAYILGFYNSLPRS